MADKVLELADKVTNLADKLVNLADKLFIWLTNTKMQPKQVSYS
ncbi:hypothetical protein [Bacillus sp. FJAT-29937]|nr:hypothetical protein [Bacillus sp. FJAT-29937]